MGGIAGNVVSYGWKKSTAMNTRALNYQYAAMCVYQLIEAREQGVFGCVFYCECVTLELVYFVYTNKVLQRGRREEGGGDKISLAFQKCVNSAIARRGKEQQSASILK
jgi:hypothetical protein